MAWSQLSLSCLFSTYAIVNKNLSALLYLSSDLLDPIANWMQQPRRYTAVTTFVSLRQHLCKTDTSMLGILSSSEFAPARLHFACHKTLLSDCKSLKLSSNKPERLQQRCTFNQILDTRTRCIVVAPVSSRAYSSVFLFRSSEFSIMKSTHSPGATQGILHIFCTCLWPSEGIEQKSDLKSTWDFVNNKSCFSRLVMSVCYSSMLLRNAYEELWQGILDELGDISSKLNMFQGILARGDAFHLK